MPVSHRASQWQSQPSSPQPEPMLLLLKRATSPRPSSGLERWVYNKILQGSPYLDSNSHLGATFWG